MPASSLMNKEVVGILRSPLIRNGSLNRSVHFEPPINLQELLTKYTNGGDPVEMDGLITHVHNLTGKTLIVWLKDMADVIPLLKPKMENFVCALLRIKWSTEETSVVEAFKNFLVNLLSAQSYYTRPVVQMLLSNFLETTPTSDDADDRSVSAHNSHEVIKAVLRTVPLAAQTEILSYSQKCMPYVLTPQIGAHTSYMKNLLELSTYYDRPAVFRVIVHRLVELDVRLPRDEAMEEEEEEEDDGQFQMDSMEDNQQPNMTSIARANLDASMAVFFSHISCQISSSGDDEFNKRLYYDLLQAFESHILPTWATSHVQFIFFYLVSLRPAYFGHFLDWLWKRFLNPNTPGIVRQACVGYVASLVSRATFIDTKTTKSVLKQMTDWCYSYIQNCGLRNPRRSESYNEIEAHGPFFAACQAVFYLFAFRHEEFVHNKKLLNFLQNCNFNTIVTCHLNPLRVCLPTVVRQFAAISRNYQLAYCDTIIQKNNRNNLPVIGNLSGGCGRGEAKPVLLDSFFPFDPYNLKESQVFISPIYRQYTGDMPADEDSEEDENDGMVIEDSVGSADKKINSFIYGVSPGFKT